MLDVMTTFDYLEGAMKKLTPEARRVANANYPTSLKFKDPTLLDRLDRVGSEADLNRRQLMEVAIARLLNDYEQHGTAALIRPRPVTAAPQAQSEKARKSA